MLLRSRQGHCVLDGDDEAHLPALTLDSGTILPRGHSLHGIFFWHHHGEPVLPAERIRRSPQARDEVSVRVKFFPGLTAHTVDHEVRMDMPRIHVRGHQNLVAVKLIGGKLQRNFVCSLRREMLLGRKRLHQMVEHLAVCFLVLQLRVHHLPVGILGHAVDSRD